MFCQKELALLEKTLHKVHLQTLYLDPEAPVDHRVDLGFRATLGWDEHYRESLYLPFLGAHGNTAYHLKDPFQCQYVFFLLPEEPSPRLFVIGPYLSEEQTHEQMMERAEEYGVKPERFALVQKFFSSIPVIPDDSALFVLLDTFLEQLWGENYHVEDISQHLHADLIPDYVLDASIEPEESPLNMEILERRYAHENEMMQAVMKGQEHKLERLMSSITDMHFERRLSDPLRNLKNYCIIYNTLLRKAAENGGVHPMYLDRMSSAYARKIEQMPSAQALKDMMNEMGHDYCRMVRHSATSLYSDQIQEIVMHIDLNLSGDLSLKALAHLQNLNASYLSSRFKKETGQTLTDFITERRIRYACKLLASTRLQIQTISLYCGIADVNYFSRIFKKYTGKTPGEYRKER